MNQTPPPVVVAAPPEDEIDLVRYLDVLIASRWLIASIAGVVLALGVAYAFLARPVYRADILVQVEDNPNSANSLLGDVSSLFDVKAQATAEIEILRSRMVVSKAVDNLRLYISAKPKYFPFSVPASPAAPRAYPSQDYSGSVASLGPRNRSLSSSSMSQNPLRAKNLS